MTRLGALALGLAAILLRPGPAEAAGLEAERRVGRTYALGQEGWSLERFGDRVAILRTAVVSSSDKVAPAGQLVLSCDGAERRWRLGLPERLPTGRALATLLVRQPDPASSFRVAAVRIAQGRVLTVVETGPVERGVVFFLVRLLKSGTPRIDLLLGSERIEGAGSNAAVAVIVLVPTVQRTDLVAFDDFLASCGARKG